MIVIVVLLAPPASIATRIVEHGRRITIAGDAGVVPIA